MGAAGDTERNTARRCTDDHALICVGDVVSHLFHTACSNKWCVGAHIRSQAGRRKSRCNTDGILFGDTQFEESLGKLRDP